LLILLLKIIKEHVSKYGFPVDNFTSIVFTGKGIPGRNLDLIQNADAVIIVDGKVGTLNEFTIAFHLAKKIGVLDLENGLSRLIKLIAEKVDKNNEKENIIYEKNGKELVKRLNRIAQ
jgi:predicted Rossmann-fold nucleotide-binding protein